MEEAELDQLSENTAAAEEKKKAKEAPWPVRIERLLKELHESGVVERITICWDHASGEHPDIEIVWK